MNLHFFKHLLRDLPSGPVVKTFHFNAGNVGWFPGHGTKILHASGQNCHQIKQKQYLGKIQERLKNSPHQKIFN